MKNWIFCRAMLTINAFVMIASACATHSLIFGMGALTSTGIALYSMVMETGENDEK